MHEDDRNRAAAPNALLSAFLSSLCCEVRNAASCVSDIAVVAFAVAIHSSHCHSHPVYTAKREELLPPTRHPSKSPRQIPVSPHSLRLAQPGLALPNSWARFLRRRPETRLSYWTCYLPTKYLRTNNAIHITILHRQPPYSHFLRSTGSALSDLDLIYTSILRLERNTTKHHPLA